MKISHRPLSMRLRIWQRRPSQCVEVADHRDAARVRRPDREQHAVDALVRRELRAEPLVELAVRALEQQMIVERPERRAEGVGVLVGLDAAVRASPRADRRGRSLTVGQPAPRRSRPCAARARRSARRRASARARGCASGTKARIDPARRRQMRPQHRERVVWRAAAIASTSSSLARQFSTWLTPPCFASSGQRLERRVPNLVAYSAIVRSDENQPTFAVLSDARAQPGLAVAPRGVDVHLRRPIGVEVGADHEIVVMRQRVDEAAIAVAVVGGEDARSRSRRAPRAGSARLRCASRRIDALARARPRLPRRSGRR